MIYSNFIIYNLIIFGIFFSNNLQAQCSSWEGHPKGIEQAKEQHAIYRDLFNSKQYEKAFPVWQQLFQSVQVPKEAPSRHFKDGIKLYYAFAKAATNSNKKEVYVDSIIYLYQQQENCIGKNASDKVWLGYHLYSLQTKPSLTIQAFETALLLDSTRTASTVIFPMAQLAVYLHQKKHPKFTKEYLTSLYHQLKKLAKANNTAAYLKKWAKAEQEFLRIQDALNTIWDCAFFENYWKPLYLKDSSNMEQNKEILKVLKNKCGKSTAFYKWVLDRQEYLKIIDHDPINLSISQQGKYQEKRSYYFLKQGDTLQYKEYRAKAFELYEEAIQKEDSTLTAKETADLAYRIAYEAYSDKNFPKARKWCRTASVHQPNWGEPYLLVGNLYASSFSKCALEDFDGRVVIWVALDEWRKAKKVDPSLREKVNERIKRYQKYLPTYSNIFQETLQIGAPYTVGCWIKQKTTIQVIKE